MQIPWFKPEPLAIPLPDVSVLPDRITLHPFGALVAAGVLLGVSVASRRARIEGIHPRVLGEMAAYVLVGGFVLGHVLDAVFYHWEVVRENPAFVLQLWNGLSSFGGFAGAIIGGLVWLARRRYPLLPFADLTSYAFPFAWLLGRLGCFVTHDHPGRVTDFPLAVADYQVSGMSPPWQTRHDLGLYEVFWCAAMIPVFLWLGRTKRPRGFYAAIVPMLYAPVRFALDFLRATDIPNGDPRVLFGLTPGHYGAILLFLVGLAVWLHIRRAPRYALPRDIRWTAEDEGTPDPRTVEELLPLVGAVRGPVRIEVPEIAAAHVARWPGGALVIDARGDAPPLEAIAEEIAALGPARLHVWRVSHPSEALAALVAANSGTERDVAVSRDADAVDAIAEALRLPVYVEANDAPAWAAVERDDGGLVFGMLGEPAAR
ncbi:MAG: prolipoprotein diacylglyceryl transferase [Sandaracinaceae bacterium]|nr:prolipoprotein diacylglyceryl transferase [Sandaracinaceae bacterium]